MGYRIATSYNWYRTDTDIMLIKTYYINGVAFTFNELPIENQDPDIITEANDNINYTPEMFFLKSFYLIGEECHPMLFELDLENPELLDEIEELKE